ncbi:MAG: carotenoid biosynthesis protein [Leptolyngbya sp. SIO3F4]|nr:carotenoid biosynthesis protein [Leptolyngbya sp. SIO3F4]
MLKRNDYFVIVLFVLHAVGVAGLVSEYRSWFQLLTPANLLISLGILLWAHRGKNTVFWITAAGIFAAGFLLEVMGVNTGFPFGTYSYGPTLGWKLWDTPLMIGVNWLMLIIACGSAANRVPLPWYIKVLVGAGLMVLLDFMIEPVAIALDFWSWEGDTIPFRNYVSWFVASVILLWAYFRLPFGKTNKVGGSLYIIQFVFFTALNFLLE